VDGARLGKTVKLPTSPTLLAMPNEEYSAQSVEPQGKELPSFPGNQKRE
jgi:hypothetical protein